MHITEQKARKNLVSLTPLIDVVFILLVFFMLTSSFSKWKTIELAIGETETITQKRPAQSLITVDFNGNYLLDGEKKSLDAIFNHIKHSLSLRQDHAVLIKPVNDLPLQQLITVLDTLDGIANANISLVKDERQ